MPQGTVSSNLTASAMKFLGIDYGAKRIGIAVSDDRGRLAFPKIILANDAVVVQKIADIVKEENAGEVVVGESLNFAGQPNKIAEDIDIFISALKNLNLLVRQEKEFLTSVEARRLLGSKERADATAAALILQRYLDKMNQAAKDYR